MPLGVHVHLVLHAHHQESISHPGDVGWRRQGTVCSLQFNAAELGERVRCRRAFTYDVVI